MPESNPVAITHRIRGGGVVAWRYGTRSNPPPWVQRRFHAFPDGKLCAREAGMCITVTQGDWIVSIGGIVLVMPDRDFQRVFEAAGG
jgi:hypothetical protein